MLFSESFSYPFSATLYFTESKDSLPTTLLNAHCALCSARCADPFTQLSNQRQACHLRIYTSPFARDSSHKSRGISGPFLLLFVIFSYMINGRIYKQFVLSEQINSIISYFQIPWYNQREKTSGRLLLGNSCSDFSRHEYQGHQNVGSAWFAKDNKKRVSWTFPFQIIESLMVVSTYFLLTVASFD